MDVKPVLLVIGWMLASAACNPKQRLVADLFRYYDKRVEPFGPNTTLDVRMDLTLVEISDIDEKKQVLTTNCWIYLRWEDASLAWQPEKHKNVTEIRVPADAIWTPDMRIKNSVESNQISPSGINNAILRSSGNVLVFYQVILKTSCQIDVASFPMDQQQCRMMFESWTYHGDQLNISSGEQGAPSLSEYLSNAEWELISYTNARQVLYYSCCTEPYLTLTYTMTLRRRPLFFLMYLMVPCLIITLVALLGLLVPNESGEKISIGITSLLAMIALLLVISTFLPPTSLAIPLIGRYFAINIVIVSLSIGLAVFTMNIHHRGTRGHRLPRLVKTVCFNSLARILFIKIDPPESTDENMVLIRADDEAMDADKPGPTMTEGQPGGGNNVVGVLNRLLHTVEKATDLHKRRITSQDSLAEATYEWKQLTIVLERALTIIFLIVTLCTTCVMFS
ncbi:neuronal acetylcholine receptor subunit alpha-10-like isoform X5 [Haliotis rubra]|uniref:neuronal acetylcholine receptor subunit alpha-10-like isoform X5 n=1 Tax=Haliotis rubra TaxID=36100 RepID=UPI001EE5D99E|nr:neuronal acetylcholine receptor subunit alpha-10-like isoform X5 [Haliotis rubra]